MYRKSLSNLLGGSLLLVATVAALSACGGDAGTGTETAGTPGTPTNTGGTPAPVANAGRTGSAGTTAAAAGARAAAGSSSTTSGVSTAGKTGGAGTAAATAGATATAGNTAAAAGGTASAAGANGGAAGGGAAGSTGGGALGGPLKYTGEFTMGMTIDEKYKCPTMGDNKSPALAWSGGPADTKSFAIVLFDTTYMMLHWAIWDIPAAVNMLPEGLAPGYELTSPAGAHQVANMGNERHAYYGPCSGGGGFLDAGTYEYRLYALKVDSLGLMESSTPAQAQAAIEGMMLEKAVWAGKPPM